MFGSSTNLLARLATRLFAETRDTEVIEATLNWQTAHWGVLLLSVLVLIWVLVVLVHRSRRVELSMRWRVVLGLLRASVVAIPVLMLAQPYFAARMERREPRVLAVLLDRSGSMSLKDGGEADEPTSRWHRAVETLVPAISSVSGRGSTGPNRESFGLRTYVFDESTDAVELTSLNEFTSAAASRKTAIGPALQAVRRDLAGQPLAGVLLISDGADNASPIGSHALEAARRMGTVGVPVYTCLAGTERPRELSVSLTADAPYAFADDPLELRARIEQQGFDGHLVTVTLMDGDRVAETRDVTLGSDGQPVIERFEVRPDAAGSRRYRVQVETLPGELTIHDNEAVADVRVIEEAIRVLYVERWPRWQYRFLRNALLRDQRFDSRLVLLTEDPATPAEERQTASFPTSEDELEGFDVIVLGDLSPQDLSPEQWQWTYDHVMDGGAGLILIAGPMHMPAAFIDHPLGGLLPFERVMAGGTEETAPFRPGLTPWGSHHPLMRWGFGEDPVASWSELPLLQWYTSIADLKPGAVVLAEHPADPGGSAIPMFVLQRSGRGAVLFVGTDETWKWRYEVGNRYFYGFWGHAIQHVGMPHRVGEYQSVRIEPASDVVAPGVPMNVSVALEAEARLGDLNVDQGLVLIAEPDGGGAPLSFPLERTADSPFLHEGRIILGLAGEYRLLIEGHEDEGEATVEVSATGAPDPEVAQARVNPDLLRQIADVSGGRFVYLPELPKLVEQLDLTPLRYRWSQQIPLWDGWLMLSALAVLLGVEWVLRKWKYLP